MSWRPYTALACWGFSAIIPPKLFGLRLLGFGTRPWPGLVRGRTASRLHALPPEPLFMMSGVTEYPPFGLGKAIGVIRPGVLWPLTGCEKNFPLMASVAHSAKRLRCVIDAKVDRVIDPLPDFHVCAHGGEGTPAASHALGGICVARERYRSTLAMCPAAAERQYPTVGVGWRNRTLV